MDYDKDISKETLRFLNRSVPRIKCFLSVNRSLGIYPRDEELRGDIELACRNDMPIHIFLHGLAVAFIALYLSRGDDDIDRGLILSGGILHDIGKIHSINDTNKDLSHARVGYEILKSTQRYREAIISLYHLITDFENPFITKEARLINVADKAVSHEVLVGIEKRFEDLRDRYPDYKHAFTAQNEDIYKAFWEEHSGSDWSDFMQIANDFIQSLKRDALHFVGEDKRII